MLFFAVLHLAKPSFALPHFSPHCFAYALLSLASLRYASFRDVLPGNGTLDAPQGMNQDWTTRDSTTQMTQRPTECAGQPVL